MVPVAGGKAEAGRYTSLSLRKRRLLCLVLHPRALFQSQFSTGACDTRRGKIPKSSAAWHCERYSPSAFHRSVSASLRFEAGANVKCILPDKSLTTCTANNA